ncbi:MAG: SIMPL domain-containing protein [Anaeromyxobacteraceae bacterium]
MRLTAVRTHRSATLVGALCAVLLPAAALAVAPGEPPPRAGAQESLPQPPSPPAPARWPRALRVIGEGRSHAAPDVAIATVGVVATDASLAKATRDADARAKKVQAVVAAAGVAPADVQTSRYDVDIERRADRPDEAPRVVGYRVVNELRVKVRDLAALGGLLDKVVAAGANEVQGLQFAKEDTTAEQGRALAAAVRAARAKAEEMARAAGLRLGELLELSEGVRSSPGPIVPMRAMSMAKSSGVAVQSGEIEIDAQVEAVFALP